MNLRATFVAMLLVGGCASSATLAGRVDALRANVERARTQGAERCAPRELATAEASADFAATEMAQANADRAGQHLTVGETNVRAALARSPADRCARREVEVTVISDRDQDGIVDERDACPDDPEDRDGVADEDGCPETDDTDRDGIDDSRDTCPTDPEDADGYLDLDGCPEPDNDLDGIADLEDRCASSPEDLDGFNDTDGCPDFDNDSDTFPDQADRCPNEPGIESEGGCPRQYENVQVTATAIRITQTIHFEFNRAVIREISHPLLNTVAQVMQDYPEFTVEVQGHTDNRGNDAFNMRLSQERADAVRAYLIGRGISPNRMTSRGYGETMPIESNRSNAGRALNRRVEFRRTDPGSANTPSQPSAPTSP